MPVFGMAAVGQQAYVYILTSTECTCMGPQTTSSRSALSSVDRACRPRALTRLSAMDVIKEYASKAATAVDDALKSATQGATQAVAAAVEAGQSVAGQSQEVLDTSKGKLDEGLAFFNGLQDQAFGAAKEGIEYCITHPEVGYPVAATTALVAFPGARRLLYRLTIARLRNPESVVAASGAKLEALAARVEEFGKEAQKLAQRAAAADEEMTRGYHKLKAARAELQRLEAAVSRSERSAEGVLGDLRLYRKAPRATELRADAAQKLAALKQQRSMLHKEITKIAKKDV